MSDKWIVIVKDAEVQFSSNGSYRLIIDGCEFMEGRYLGKTRIDKKGKLITWYNWAKGRWNFKLLEKNALRRKA